MPQFDDNEKTVISTKGAGRISSNAARVCPKCKLVVADSTSVCPQDGTQIFEAPEAEDLLSSKYEFITVTGSGGMSVVYKARQLQTGEIVAIKMLHSLLMNEQSLKRFQQEAKAITSLKHPNIINVHDFGVSEHGQPYMVMDFIEGTTLADVIKEKGGLSVEESLHRFIQLCDALEHAHECGILHRDLKPSNIMISNRAGNFEDARIVDFGIAKMLDQDDPKADDGHLTRTGELFGSPLYMSPEQCRGGSVDARTDIYSMGCVMYETLTGLPPLKGNSLIETIFLQMNEPPLPMSEMCPDKRFPDALEQVIAKALAKEPSERYQSMTELEFALMQIQPNQSNKKSVKVRKEKRAKGKTPAIIAAAAVAGSIATAVPMFFWMQQEQLKFHAQSKNASVVSNLPATEDALINLATRITGVTKDGYIKDAINKNKDGLTDEGLITCLKDGDMGLRRVDLENVGRISDRSGPLLGNQKNLVYLNLDGTSIGNRTLEALTQCKQLQVVSLRRTKVNEEGLQGLISSKESLKKLFLSESRVSKYGLLTIANNFKNLEELSISNLEFDPRHFDRLSSLPLVCLHADGTHITDRALQLIGQKVKTLTEIHVGQNEIHDNALVALCDLPNLLELGVQATFVGDASVTKLPKLKLLKNLDIGQTLITDKALQTISQMSQLEHLSVHQTKISDAGTSYIAKLKNLTELNVGNTALTDAALTNICTIPNLRYLDIGGTSVTDAVLPKIANMKALKEVNFVGCPNITIKGVRALMAQKKDLEIRLLFHLTGWNDTDIDWNDPRNFKNYPPH